MGVVLSLDRRSARRFVFAAPMHIRTSSGRALRAFTANVSVSGCLGISSSDPACQAEVVIDLDPPDGDARISLPGEIVWSQGFDGRPETCFGVRFCDPRPSDAQRLLALVSKLHRPADVAAPLAEVRKIISTKAALLARERAITFLVNQRLEERRAADGRRVGIQSRLATDAQGENGIDLYEIIDGLVIDPADAANCFADDPVRDLWQDMADTICNKLGFPLEPELFSNMLFVAYAGGIDSVYLQHISRALLRTFRNSDARGLYHFFTSMRFAGDVDCTAIAARARLVMRDIDLDTHRGASDLRTINDRILGSAAVCDIACEDNVTHGKSNGPLSRHVFKVYLDDHGIHGSDLDRGLKNNPVVAANALYPILVELAHGTRSPEERVGLKEFAAGLAVPRTGEAKVADIVAANICYAGDFLLGGHWRAGCRYYPFPEVFLCFYSEILRMFPEVVAFAGTVEAMQAAVVELRTMDGSRTASSLNIALRAIAAANVGLDTGFEVERLVATQFADGSWPDFGALYRLGSSVGVYFGSSIQTAAFAAVALGPRNLAPVATGRRNDGWSEAIRSAVMKRGRSYPSESLAKNTPPNRPRISS